MLAIIAYRFFIDNKNMQDKFKYYSSISMIFVGILLTANVLGPKPVLCGSVILPAGLMIFPLTYVVGLILTEVYGFAASRIEGFSSYTEPAF
jgi:uncharacterized PurR-regulated membrane protein YhhQ (DUF165 family)